MCFVLCAVKSHCYVVPHNLTEQLEKRVQEHSDKMYRLFLAGGVVVKLCQYHKYGNRAGYIPDLICLILCVCSFF